MAWLAMVYYAFTTLFAQLAIMLRLATTSGYFTPTTSPRTQGVRCDEEEPLDRLLPVFYEFRTGCFRDSWFDPRRVASQYGLPPSPLKQNSEANTNFKSDHTPRPSFQCVSDLLPPTMEKQ